MLTTAEYSEIMQRKEVLKGIIVAADADVTKFTQMVKACKVQMDTAKSRLQLYINHLSDDVKEYEDAHPTEPIDK